MKEYEYFIVNKSEEESKGKKTDVFNLTSKSGSHLGQVQWYPQWRQYCFFPARDCVFSVGCLKDINDFIEGLR